MIMQALYKYIALLGFFLFFITKSHSQSLPITSYGVWDRGAGVVDYSNPNSDFIKGIEISANWDEIQHTTVPTFFDFSLFQQKLDLAVTHDKMIRFSINVGPDCPSWLFSNGVPLVNVTIASNSNQNYAYRHPHYLDPEYKAYYFELIRRFALFLREQPQATFDHIAFVQVKTGATGDEAPYKGTVTDSNYAISSANWQSFRLEAFAKFKLYFNDVTDRKIVLTFNNVDPVDETLAYNYVMTQLDANLGFGIKGGAYNRGHHLTDEQLYKEQWNPFLINPRTSAGNPNGRKLFSASEMDQSWSRGFFALNYEIGFYWSALGGINTGLSCTNITGTAMTYALANPEIIDIFKMYNRYAQQVYPATATTAFSIFHEGLNSADTVKFPVSTYGPATRTNLARYQAICNDPIYANRGARIDDPTYVTAGQVSQRESQEFYNDAGWEICEGNIERFMTQINPDGTSIGLFRVRGPITATSSKYDRFARSFESSTSKNTMYFQLHNELPANNKILKFTIIWLDKNAGSTWAFQYTNSEGLQSRTFTGTGTNEWRTEIITISDAIINQGGTLQSDFMLVNTDTTDDIFNGIEMNILGISRQTQTINFSPLPSKTLGDADFSAGATASSGLTVSYTSSNSDVATIVNGNIHIVGVGTSTITASQAGDANYNVATPVTQDITVNKLNQSITFNSLPSKTVGDADFSPLATASSGLAVTYTSSNMAVATIVNGNIRIVGGGSSIITASQGGNSSYNAAISVTQNLAVPAVNQATITTSGTWTCPAGVTSIQVEAWGGGGSGGSSSTGGVGGGGAGGSYVINQNVTVVPGTSYTVTIGTGGVANNNGSANGTAGGNSQFSSTVPVIANGGVIGANATGTGVINTAFGLGGVNTVGGSGGTVTIGGSGANAAASRGGKGGDGAGPNGGAGGASDTVTSGTGNSGSSPGGGGSGAFGAATGGRAGGAGGAGQIKITYTVGVPNAPTIGTATVSGVSGQASISFTAPTFNGNSTITSYTATSSPGGITATLSQAGSGTIIMNGLTNGTAYTFTVSATNSIGQSAESVASNSVTPIAQTNGTGGGSWSEITTWKGEVVPTINDTVEILGSDNVTLNGTGICNNLTITGGSLTISSGSLTVKNTLVNNGNIVIENNANLIQTSEANSNFGTGTAIVKRNSASIQLYDYTLWSSPVAGQKLKAFSQHTLDTRFYTYNTTTSLYNVVTTPLTTTDFATATGYLIRAPNNWTAAAQNTFIGVFTGVLNNGTVPFTMVDGGAGKRFNLVGNPYPSPITISTFVSDNSVNITGTLYFWRKTNGSGTAYCTYTGSTFVTNNNAQSANPNGVIQTGQGFFVEGTGTGTALTFKNTQRVANTANQFFRTNLIENNRIWLNLTNATGVFSQTAVGYITDATQGVDSLDGKYINDAPIALTSIINAEEYTIQSRALPFSTSDTVPLGFKTNAAGNYTIAIDHFDGLFSGEQAIYLKDNTTGNETDLKAGSYTFNAPAGIDNARFSLKYQRTLNVDAPEFNQNNVRVYINNGTLYVNSGTYVINTIEVYDIQGRLIEQQKSVKATTATIHNLKVTKQVLIIKIIDENSKVVIKKIVN